MPFDALWHNGEGGYWIEFVQVQDRPLATLPNPR